MLGKARTPLTFCTLAFCTAACAECAPGRVSSGVARLTIRNLGAIAELINQDPICGFESEAVKNDPSLDRKAGRATWRVEECTIDLSEPFEKIDCNGVATRMSGKVTVTADRIVEGTITGDEENPVAPTHPDAVTVDISEARFEDFVVTVSGNE